jgi:O-antigen ligase
MAKSKVVKKTTDTNPVNWLIAGLAVTTLYFQTNLADPFNSPKMWIVFILASWLTGYLYSSRKLIKEIMALRNTGLFIAFFVASGLFVTLVSDFKYVAIFGDTQRRNGFLSYLSLSLIMFASAFFIRMFNVIRIYTVTYFIGIVTLGYAILQTSGKDFVKWNNPYNSIIGTVGNPNFAAAVMAIVGVLIFSMVLNSDFNKIYRFFGLIITVLLYVVIYLSDARQGLLAFTLGIGVFVVIYLFNKNKKLGIVASSAGIVAFIFSFLGMLQIGPLEKFLYKPSVSVRGYYWRAGFEMFKDKPLTGVGMDRYGAYFKEVREVGYPLSYGFDITSSNAHNTFIQFFATGGIFLGISYLALNLYIAKRAVTGLRHAKGNDKYLLAGIFSAWIAFHAQSLVSIDNIGISIWGWLLGGAIIGLSISATSDENIDKSYFASKPGSIDLNRAFISGVLGLVAVIIVSMLYRGENAAFKARGNFNLEDPATKTAFYNFQKEVINNKFSDPSYVLSSGMYLARGGYVDEGLAAVKDVYNNDPRNLDALNALILASEQLGKNEDAISYRLKMVELDQWNAKNYLALGLLYKAKGDLVNTKAMLDKIFSFASSDPIAAQAKAELA